MSHHVYIANPGFKDEPISFDSWNAALEDYAKSTEGTSLREGQDLKTNKRTLTIYVDGDFRKRINISPHGLGQAEEPDRQLIEMMFDIASRLNAQVYSERLKAYESPDDWEKRTAPYRARRDEHLSAARKKRNRRHLVWAAVILFCVVFLWKFALT